MDGHQGRRTGSIDHQCRSRQVKEVRESACGSTGDCSRERIWVNGLHIIRTDMGPHIVAVTETKENTGVRMLDGRKRIARILKGKESSFQQHALLWVQCCRLLR